MYLECYVPEDGPDKETVVKYANKWGAIVLFSFFKFYTSFFLVQRLSPHPLPILFQYLFLLPCMPYLSSKYSQRKSSATVHSFPIYISSCTIIRQPPLLSSHVGSLAQAVPTSIINDQKVLPISLRLNGFPMQTSTLSFVALMSTVPLLLLLTLPIHALLLLSLSTIMHLLLATPLRLQQHLLGV